MITRKQLIKKYIDFFKTKNHKEIQNSSLIPENDPTVLFTTAGMHPLVPFLLGQKHPQGKRLCNNQRCIRTGDINEVGDEVHLTFFEMLGNWSLGDYFKQEAIEMSFEFLTKNLKIPKEKLKITVFGGDKRVPQIPKDDEASKIWESLNIKKQKIEFLKGGVLESDNNWWGPAGKTGPCGPCTEMFVNNFEIWNDVFMQYNKDEKENYTELKQKNVDTGMGVERTLAILNNKSSVYETETFQPIIKQIEKISKKKYNSNKKSMRIIADHIKASVFIIADGILPSNSEQGYVLRRLIRRAIRYGRELNLKNFTIEIAKPVFEIYDDYKHLQKNKKIILKELEKEEKRFLETLERGLRILEKIFKEKEPINKKKFKILMDNPNKSLLIGRIFDMKRNKKDYSLKKPKISKQEIDNASINGKETFLLYQSYGFPLEMVDELAMLKGLLVDHHSFREELNKHQELSRTATQGKFKSGLADNSEQVKKLHTATHLLAQALRQVLKKPDLHQRGSNITEERTRFDFNFDRKLTKEELQKVEDLVNKKIKEKIPITCEYMTPKQAKEAGAQGIFDSKYGDRVSIYTIKDFSKEICAGPHVSNTSELGKFKIKKEGSSSSGVRRIKAILE
jgi:alanyl-tRNA synthetase